MVNKIPNNNGIHVTNPMSWGRKDLQSLQRGHLLAECCFLGGRKERLHTKGTSVHLCFETEHFVLQSRGYQHVDLQTKTTTSKEGTKSTPQKSFFALLFLRARGCLSFSVLTTPEHIVLQLDRGVFTQHLPPLRKENSVRVSSLFHSSTCCWLANKLPNIRPQARSIGFHTSSHASS